MSINSITLVAAATLAMIAGTAQAANGFANGGFETADPVIAGNAASWLDAASGYTRTNAEAHTGSFSALLASPAFNAAVMLQNSIEQGNMPPLLAGDTPEFSFWAKGFAGGTGNVLYALRYLDGTGNILANSGNQFFQGGLTNDWKQFTFNLGAVPVGATAAFVEFSQAMGPIDDFNLPGAVYIDDIQLSVTAVPEPETYAMMLAGLAAVGAMVRRRRRQA